MSPEHQLVDDDISRAAFDLLLKEPFYAHVLAGMPREVTDQVKTSGLRWNGQQVVLRVNPLWFGKGLAVTQRKIALKHEVLHVVFRHLFRPGDRDARLNSIAADLVVNQLLAPLKALPGWPLIETFPELTLKPDQPVEVYYAALADLLRSMCRAGYSANGEQGGGQSDGNDSNSNQEVAKATSKPVSAEALAKLLEDRGKRGDDSGWHDGNDGLGAVAGRYVVGSVLIRARERMPPHQWGSLPAALLSELGLILAEREPKLDWKRVVRIFCASSGRTKIRHTVKRISKRYGTRPGIKIQRLQRLLVAVDTSGSIIQNMVELFFTEIHAAWKSGASVTVVECDAQIQRYYEYCGKPPEMVAGGGGTDFEPVFQWMRTQRNYDGCLYLTDGCGPAPTTRPASRLLWVVADDADRDLSELPFGPTIKIQTQ